MRFGVILLAIPLVLGVAEAAQARPGRAQHRWQPPTVVVTQHARLPGLRFWGEPYAWTSDMTPPRHRLASRKAWRPGRSGHTWLPGLQFYGQPYAWTTPMGPRYRAEIRRAPQVAMGPMRPAVLSVPAAPASRIERVRTNDEPDVAPRERRRPSGTAKPKATRVIPLFNVPEDQR